VHISALSSSSAVTLPIASRLVAGGLAMVLGLALFLTAGFATPDTLHNATHDTRHSLGLPCH
jgi:cobalt transporter subunit CbtB